MLNKERFKRPKTEHYLKKTGGKKVNNIVEMTVREKRKQTQNWK